MTQSTIDSELEEILDLLWGNRDLGKAWDAAQAAITNLIAQETNKARKELLLKLKQAPPIDWLDANASIDQWLAQLDAKITADKELNNE